MVHILSGMTKLLLFCMVFMFYKTTKRTCLRQKDPHFNGAIWFEFTGPQLHWTGNKSWPATKETVKIRKSSEIVHLCCNISTSIVRRCEKRALQFLNKLSSWYEQYEESRELQTSLILSRGWTVSSWNRLCLERFDEKKCWKMRRRGLKPSRFQCRCRIFWKARPRL